MLLKSKVEIPSQVEKEKALGLYIPHVDMSQILTAYHEFGIDNDFELINKIYNFGDITKLRSTLIFITLPRKLGTN